MKLQNYDQLLQERVKDLKLYQSMKNGDFSHMISYKNRYDANGSILAHQSTSEICKQLIPQLVKRDSSYETSQKRMKQSASQSSYGDESHLYNQIVQSPRSQGDQKPLQIFKPFKVSNVTKFSISPKNINSIHTNNFEDKQSASISQTGMDIQSTEDQRHMLMNNLIQNIEMRNTRREN